MDLSKLVGQQLLKISQSSETGQHVIEFTQPNELGPGITEIDPTKLGMYWFLLRYVSFVRKKVCIWIEN